MKAASKIVIDASNSILGRIASYAAKQALLGKDVVIVNCENALVTGPRKSIVSEYGLARRRGGSSLKGPHFPKHPERLMKRTVRGMLSYKQGRGLAAFRRIICHNSVPHDLASLPKITFHRAITANTITLSELSKVI